jgi:sugar fermentation stimulation protein A
MDGDIGYNLQMRFSDQLLPGILIQRYKRFLADVRLSDGRVVTAHCTNTGSMMGCNAPGSTVYVSPSTKQGRRLLFTWEIVKVGRTWVGINTMHPNRLVAESIENGVLSELQGYQTIRREVVTRQGTRLDLRLENSNGFCFVEVKNVTLAIDGAAAFPDAISQRGTKHLKELMWLRRKGHRAAVVFVIQRADCNYFRPADEIDSEYGHWLRRAVKAGVEALAYRARVTAKEVVLTERLEAKL